MTAAKPRTPLIKIPFTPNEVRVGVVEALSYRSRLQLRVSIGLGVAAACGLPSSCLVLAEGIGPHLYMFRDNENGNVKMQRPSRSNRRLFTGFALPEIYTEGTQTSVRCYWTPSRAKMGGVLIKPPIWLSALIESRWKSVVWQPPKRVPRDLQHRDLSKPPGEELEVKTRACMKCQKDFRSIWIGDRLCKACKNFASNYSGFDCLPYGTGARG